MCNSSVAIAARSWPAHVPDELVWDHSLAKFAAEGEDPFTSVSRLHNGPDIVWCTDLGRGRSGWILTRFAPLQEAFRRSNLFSRYETSEFSAMVGEDWRLNPLEIEPPGHGPYRAILQPYFNPRAIYAMDDLVRGVARELIGRFKDNGHCEFVSEFASLFPSYVFMHMMGLPREELPQLLGWENDFIRGSTDDVRRQAARNIIDYLHYHILDRQKKPLNDLISHIVTANIDGRSLEYHEYMGMCSVLYLGGLDTVLNSLGCHIRHLALDLPLQRRLKETPSDVPRAVEELLRAYGVVGTLRYITEDVEFHGVSMKRGDLALMDTRLAGRDERQYEEPHRVNIDRRDLHLSLGAGVHYCLGMHLARRELRIVLEEFTSTFSDFRISPGEAATFHTVSAVWGVSRLPLEWSRVDL